MSYQYEEEGSLLGDINDFLNNADRDQGSIYPHQQQTIIKPVAVDPETNLQIFYTRLQELGVKLDELGNILECDQNLLILSGAGAGKTTALILKIIRDYVSGDMYKYTTVDTPSGVTHVQVPANVLVSTFLKTGALELKAAFHEWCRKLDLRGVDASNIQFRTIHSEVMDALKQMGVNVEILEDTHSIVRSIMNKYGIRSVTSTTRSASVDEVSDMLSLLSYARNRLDANRYNHPLMQEFKLDTLLFNAVLQDFKISRAETRKLDFEDMQEMLLEAASMNQNVAAFLGNRYDYIYVDEFQDTSQLQYELLKYYFSGAKRNTVIGDTNQCIYSWRGSDNNIIGRRYEEDWRPAILNLSTNFRCSSNILDFVKPSILQNPQMYPQELIAHKEGGEVKVIYGGSVEDLVNNVKTDLMANKKVSVIARTNSDLLIPAMILELDGNFEFGLSKSVSMSGRMPRQVFGIMDLVTKRYNGDFESYFKIFLQRSHWYEAEKLSNILKANHNLNLYNIPVSDIRYSLPNLASIILGLRRTKEEMGEVEAYLYLLGVMEKQVYVKDSLYAQKARELVGFTRQIILEHPVIKEMGIHQIDNLFNVVLPERLTRRIKYSSDVFCKLTTVHEAKGKEWDSVYVWNVVDGSFPNLVGSRDLTDEEFEEERRVFYIAATRAKVSVTYYTNPSRISPFLKECNMTLANAESNETVVTDSKTQVFKKATPADIQPQTDTLLREYIIDTLGNAGGTVEAVNVELVTNVYDQDTLIERLESQYGVHLTPEHRDDVLELFFSTIADELYNQGRI